MTYTFDMRAEIFQYPIDINAINICKSHSDSWSATMPLHNRRKHKSFLNDQSLNGSEHKYGHRQLKNNAR